MKNDDLIDLVVDALLTQYDIRDDQKVCLNIIY